MKFETYINVTEYTLFPKFQTDYFNDVGVPAVLCMSMGPKAKGKHIMFVRCRAHHEYQSKKFLFFKNCYLLVTLCPN